MTRNEMYYLGRLLLMALLPSLSIFASSQHSPAVAPSGRATHEGYILELLWWPQYCHEHPQLRYCAGATFQGFVLGAFIPTSDEAQVQKCEAQIEAFRPDDKLLKVMPDETLLKAQWESYGACSGQSQTRYFDHLSRISRSVRIPKEFVSPKDHFEVSVSQTKEEFLSKNAALSPGVLYVFCRSGFLSKVQIQKAPHLVKPTEACDLPRVKVIARMPLAE